MFILYSMRESVPVYLNLHRTLGVSLSEAQKICDKLNIPMNVPLAKLSYIQISDLNNYLLTLDSYLLIKVNEENTQKLRFEQETLESELKSKELKPSVSDNEVSNIESKESEIENKIKWTKRFVRFNSTR